MNDPQHEPRPVRDVVAELTTPEEPQQAMSVMEAVSRAEIDMQIATARRYPRIVSQVKKQIMDLAQLDLETAQSCFYRLPRGGRTIEGPSVRLAEIAMSSFGNIKTGTRILATDTTSSTPHVVIQAVCHDLQNNVMVSIEKRRRIVGKKSKGGAIDEDDINLAVNACASIALRDSVFKIVPMVLVKPALEAAKRIAVGDAKTLSQRRQSCLDTFAKMDVSKEQILARLELESVEEIGLAHIEELLGYWTALKDGEAKIDEIFPILKPKFAAQAPAPATQAPRPTGPVPMMPKKAPAPKAAIKVEPTPEPAPEPEPEQPAAEQEQPAAEPEQPAEPAPEPEQPAAEEAPAEEPAAEPAPPSDDPIVQAENEAEQIYALCNEAGLTPAQLHAYLKSLRIMQAAQTNVVELSGVKRKNIIAGWNQIAGAIKPAKK